MVRDTERNASYSETGSLLERTSKLASLRLKRELERRGTLGGALALEPDPSLKRIPTEESDSDLFRSDGPDAAALFCQVEPPQSVVQGCSAQGSAPGPGNRSLDWHHWSDLR